MKKSTKAALFSILIFPGAGHSYLKKYIPGLLLIIGAAIASTFIVSNTIHTALEVVEKIQNSGGPLEIGAINQVLSQSSLTSGNSTDVALMALFAFWVVGIIDSFRIGRTL